jgi:hypothetical protein
MWRSVGLLQIDVSDECVASIFRIEEILRARKSVRRLLTDWLFRRNWKHWMTSWEGEVGCGKDKPSVSRRGRDCSHQADTVNSRRMLPMLSGVMLWGFLEGAWLTDTETNIWRHVMGISWGSMTCWYRNQHLALCYGNFLREHDLLIQKPTSGFMLWGFLEGAWLTDTETNIWRHVMGISWGSVTSWDINQHLASCYGDFLRERDFLRHKPTPLFITNSHGSTSQNTAFFTCDSCY